MVSCGSSRPPRVMRGRRMTKVGPPARHRICIICRAAAATLMAYQNGISLPCTSGRRIPPTTLTGATGCRYRSSRDEVSAKSQPPGGPMIIRSERTGEANGPGCSMQVIHGMKAEKRAPEGGMSSTVCSQIGGSKKKPAGIPPPALHQEVRDVDVSYSPVADCGGS